MTVSAADRLRQLAAMPAAQTWPALLAEALDRYQFDGTAATVAQIRQIDHDLGAVDLWLAGAAWELWGDYYGCTERTATALQSWWSALMPGRAVLILDGMSLRELPLLLAGARSHGFEATAVRATAAELPADTTSFARALGASSRSVLQADGKPAGFKLAGAVTDVVSMAFQDVAIGLPAAPDLLVWHTWPDDALHQLAGQAGQPADALAADAKKKLISDDFWALVGKLSQGRRLVITSDHGYGNTAHFAELAEGVQTTWARERFGAQRFTTADIAGAPWLPPLATRLQTPHGNHAFALGRRKWKVQGGFKGLVHGGLSLLEVAVPFVEIARKAGG